MATAGRQALLLLRPAALTDLMLQSQLPPFLQQMAARQYSAADGGGGGDGPLIVPASVVAQRQPRQPAAQQQQQLQEVAVALPKPNQGPWRQVVDKRSGLTYWHNTKTDATTPVGAAKPDAWVAVVDPRSGGSYYWNKQSGETTAVGEPLPGPEGRLAAGAAGDLYAQQQQQQMQGRPGAASLLANSLAVGFGVGLVFALIRMVF